jgi:hypothetical protein
MLNNAAMEPDPIVHAANLAGLIAELLERAAAIEPYSHEQSEVRLAEALARTLFDQLTTIRSSRAA